MRTKNSYEIRAEKFVKQIMPFLFNCQTVEDYSVAVRMFNTRYHRSVIMAHGLTRIALITSDYVIKFDYNPAEVEIFGGCEDECTIYAEAKLAGFDYLFAKISRIEINGRYFYIMPRINGIGRYYEDAQDYMTEDECDWVLTRVFDLHWRNYGWKNNHVVLIDYSAHY